MSLRLTLALLAFLSLLGAYLYFHELRKEPEPEEPPPPQFYEIEEEDIESIRLASQGKEVSFVKGSEGYFHFDAVDGPQVDMQRWGGIPLLLSGPRSQRLLTEKAESLAPYGLDRPSLVITVGLTGGADFGILVGDKTPDGQKHYVMMRGFDSVFLIDASWGDVLARLVAEPPFPSPTAAQG